MTPGSNAEPHMEGNLQGPHLVSNCTLKNLYSPVGQQESLPQAAVGGTLPRRHHDHSTDAQLGLGCEERDEPWGWVPACCSG